MRRYRTPPAISTALIYDTGSEARALMKEGPDGLLGHSCFDIPRKHHIELMRFRLGCWDIEANRPRGRARADRVCRFCATQGTRAVEDELHVLLECPAYAEMRLASGINADLGMKTVMTKSVTANLASLLYRIATHRNDT